MNREGELCEQRLELCEQGGGAVLTGRGSCVNRDWSCVNKEVELCEQGGGAGLSRSELVGLLLQLFPTVGSPDTIFVTASHNR